MSFTCRLICTDKDHLRLNDVRKTRRQECLRQIEESDEGYIDFKDILEDLSLSDHLNIGELNFDVDGEPFYYDEGVQEMFCDNHPIVMDKSDMASLINTMRSFVADYYKAILESDDKDTMRKMIADHASLWDNYRMPPYNLGKNTMANCFMTEYEIWDLIAFFNRIDWDRQFVIAYNY